jgi:hypothetical protein
MIEVLEADVPYTVPNPLISVASISGSSSYQALNISSYTSMLYWSSAARGTTSNAEAADYATYSKTLMKNRYTYAQSKAKYSLCGIDTTGKGCPVLTADKKYPLPIKLFTPNLTTSQASIGTIDYSRDTETMSHLHDSYQGKTGGFTLPTFTAADIGKPMYMRGSLDTVNDIPVFIPDGNVTLSMDPGYTYIPFGEPYNSSGSTPTEFYWDFTHTTAYTLDSNGKLTHIDGKQIAPKVTISDQAPSGGSDGDIWIQY